MRNFLTHLALLVLFPVWLGIIYQTIDLPHPKYLLFAILNPTHLTRSYYCVDKRFGFDRCYDSLEEAQLAAGSRGVYKGER